MPVWYSPVDHQRIFLNRLIEDLLPERVGYRYANADPVTGQAAWYDLTVKVTRDENQRAPRKAPMETLGPGALTARVPP